MARLPDPITNEMYVEWPERDEWAIKTKGFFNMAALVVKKAQAAERELEEVNEE